MFRDSRGVVHTVSSADPLDDLPVAASSVLARTLLVPTEGDLGSALERCEAVTDLLERWQDAFFAALPDDVDVDEEARWAAEAGFSLSDIEAQWEDEDEDADDDDSESPEPVGGLTEIDLSELEPLETDHPSLFGLGQDAVPSTLPDEVVVELESALLLLPLRVRLEALVAAATLVDNWTDLLADHEKLLGHLVLVHGFAPDDLTHELLADEHARSHEGHGGHSRRP